MARPFALLAALFVSLVFCTSASAEPLQLLFLGDNGHHRPAERFRQLEPVLKERGIELTYTDKLDDLNSETLGKYAGLVIYANQERISPEQEQALLDYVAGGKGLVALHCASFCFLNSPKYVELVGAQFDRHGTGTFSTILADSDHPILRGFGGFESFDETYVHRRHNEDRTVLEYRQERNRREPWTWVRTHGEGRVFYTAWGHDHRTWGNPGFANLVERGIRWAVGGDPAEAGEFKGVSTSRTAEFRPQMTPKRTDVQPFEYVEANVPFYPAGQRWGTVTTGPRKMQLPLPPEESIKHLVTPVGLAPRLFVSEPELAGKPIFMTWDERGRLWVCETYDYPNELQPPGRGRDRIRICEDTTGDGRADTFTVFAEELSIPTAIAFYRGGAVVQDGTRTIYLKDTDGDGRADLRKVLITGWNMRDTHGGVSNFRYGLDNWLWAMQGYNDSQPVLTDGTRGPRFRQGFFRFKLEGDGEDVAVTELEFLRSTNNNTWGLGFSEEGIVFGSTANGNPSEYLPIPNRYYEEVRGWSSSVLRGIAESNRFYPITENVRQVDHHGGFTAAAGHALYTARNYPQGYWNRAGFVAEPTGHLVATFLIQPEGAGFRSRNAFNLVASDDEWTSPIMAEVGPDGNVWVLDWYNYIVQHNPTPQGFRTGRGAAYESELRDKKHGRIYRLVYIGERAKRDLSDSARAVETPPLDSATVNQLLAHVQDLELNVLVETLRHPTMLRRKHAQRLLVERGQTDVVPQLLALVQDQSVDAIGLNVGAIHALWTLHGLGVVSDNRPEVLAAVHSALRHPSAGVRRNAIFLVSAGDEVAALLDDPEPQVRLAALLALADAQPSAAAAESLVNALANVAVQQDRWLLDAATAAAAANDMRFLAGVAASDNKALANTPAAERIAIVAEHYARGDAKDLATLFQSLEKAQPEVAAAVLAGISRGWPRDKKPELTAELDQALASLFEKAPAANKALVVSLATRWGSEQLGRQIAKIAAGLLETVENEEAADRERLSAAGQYVELLKADAAAAKLLENVTPRTSPELAQGLVEALGKAESLEVGRALAESLPRLTPAVRAAAVRTLLAKSAWTELLLDASRDGKFALAELSLDQKEALASHPDRRLAARARRMLAAGGGLPNPDRQKVLEELLPLTEQTGDPEAGKLVFKNQCAKCHTHSGEGSKIGPDLTGMAVHPKHELLLQLIDPSRSVEGNYRVYSVLTADGVVLTGLLASESRTTIEIIDAEAKKHVVLREDIENLQASNKSLMPDGFEKQLQPQQIVDLLEFLTQRGQYVPIPLDKFATVTSARGMFFDENATGERLVFPDWEPKEFEGVPFHLVDPQEGKVPNAILLYGPQGSIPPTMPRSVALPANLPAKAVHLLSGVSGWGHPFDSQRTVSMIVRLHYADGQTEDHELRNAEHFADYIRRVDVPGSKFAFSLRGRQQLRYLSIPVERDQPLAKIELLKGPDRTAPIVMAVTVETR